MTALQHARELVKAIAHKPVLQNVRYAALDAIVPAMVPVQILAETVATKVVVVAVHVVDAQDVVAADPVVIIHVPVVVRVIAMDNAKDATDAALAGVAMVHAQSDVTAVAMQAHTQIYSVASNIVLC